jgi:hypothetical protein
MKHVRAGGRIRCLALSAVVFAHVLLMGAAAPMAADLDDNLFLFPATDTQELLEEVGMGNLLLFKDGVYELEDDGVIDDSVYYDEDDGGDTIDFGDEATTGIGRVIGVNIKLREQPNTGAGIVAELNEGATLTILSKESGWLQVSFGILSGYVHSDYVFEVTDTGLNGTILRDGVNLRADCTLEGEVVRQFSGGTGVQVTDYVNGWYAVTFGDAAGYVRNDCITVTGEFTGETATRMLKSGMSGEAVKKAQEELKRRGFFVGTVTSDYGPKTTQAVKDFQKAANVKADGVLGANTLGLLYGNNNIKVTIATASQVKGRVQMTEWSRVNTIIPRGKTFKVIDVRTGVSWNERRHGGYLHIDAEPVTAEDTAKLKRVYGGSWSWNRRAVWVVYGNYVFAASMNGMPHAGESIGSSNNFNGHHCYHFYKSKTHVNQKQCSKHQAMVLAAYNAGK